MGNEWMPQYTSEGIDPVRQNPAFRDSGVVGRRRDRES